MKFKDVRTFQSLLNEYGLKPGTPTAVGGQQTGANAKANAVASPTTQKTTAKPDKGSPTTQGVDTTSTELPKYTPIKAGDLDVDSEYNDKDGNPIGKVVSKVGDKPNPDKVVVQDKKGEYQLLDPKDEVHALVDEGKLGTLVKKTQSGIKFRSKDNQGVKKLARKNKLSEQGREQIFEINFNKKEIGQEALKAPIKCGFEAETVWSEVYGSSEDENWADENTWYEVEDALSDQHGRRAVSDIEENYREWILEIAYDMEGEIIARMSQDRKEDEDYINDFVESMLDEDDIEEYKENYLDGMDEDQLEEYEDWDFIAWGRQYAEEEREDELVEWIEEEIRESGDAMDEAISEAEDEYDMDRWANREYGGWGSCLAEIGDYYLDNPEGNGGGLEEVADYLNGWSEQNSDFTNRAEYGQYGSTSGYDTWAVEDDSSIDTYSGTGAEIISPVYSSPGKMLEEMKSLFNFFNDQGVETNHSTGLHVTMSYQGKGTSNNRVENSPNKLKIAMLLGDKYLLSTFGRQNNSYAKSQIDSLKRKAAELKANPENTKTIKGIESILSKGIDTAKFSSINFKDQTDPDSGKQLVEFRIGGGDDYHLDFNKVAKAVIRYATTMKAGYTTEGDDSYNKDYAKALFRFINQLDSISDVDDERTKGRFDDGAEHPAVNVLKGFFNKQNYVESMFILASAFNNLHRYKTLKASKPGLKEDVETEKESLLKKAQEKFALGIAQAGYDLNQNLNRDVTSAKGIGILRNTVKDFELTLDELGKMITKSYREIFTNKTVSPQTTLERAQNGVERLFKKEFVELPSFASGPQVEKIASGIWSAMNSDEFKGKKYDEFISKLADVLPTRSKKVVADAWKTQIEQPSFKTEYKDFFGSITRGSYGYGPVDGHWVSPGDPISKEGYDKFIDHLKSYKPYTQPIGKGVNLKVQGGDNYTENWLSKFMIKYRTRWEELDRIKDEDLQLYIDSLKEINKSVKSMYDVIKASDDMMLDKYSELEGTDAGTQRDGQAFFGLTGYTAERLKDIVDEIDGGRFTPRSIGDTVADDYKNLLQDFFRGSFERYYRLKDTNPSVYKMGPIPNLIRKRLDAIKQFMVSFDKVTQKLGFDSQQDQIDNKLKVDKKDREFTKKNSKVLATVKTFDFGGDLYYRKEMIDELDSYSDRNLYGYLDWARNNQNSSYDFCIQMPTSHESIAREAYKQRNHMYRKIKDTWREEKVEKIYNAFRDKYRVSIDNFLNRYVSGNDHSIKQKLKLRGVVFDNGSLGDGREGMNGLGHEPLLPRKELNSDLGEPFEFTSAAAWHVNNPKLSKKAKAIDSKATAFNTKVESLLRAGGVEDYDRDSSSTIASKTNWSNLADHLGIERGVNDQGAELLRVVYNRTDGNHDWRPEEKYSPDGGNVVSGSRWAAAVLAAEDYIKKNYNVSGGNYFRKNPDGSDGDDVSGMYGSDSGYESARDEYQLFDRMMQDGIQNYMPQAEVNKLVAILNGDVTPGGTKNMILQALVSNKSGGGEPITIAQAREIVRNRLSNSPSNPELENDETLNSDDYEKARSNYFMFNSMMEMGMRNYLNRNHVNSLVAFLNNKDNDEEFKKNTLNTIRSNYVNNNGAFETFQDALAATRRNNESVFNKFDALPLQEQLDIISKVNKNKIDKLHETIEAGQDMAALLKDLPKEKKKKKKVKEDATPNNDAIVVINKLLADHFPVSDLKKQMLAFTAIPVPGMLNDFKRLRAEAGDDACARGIVRGYAETLGPEVKAKLNINEWSKQHVKSLLEAKGIMGRVVGDRFQKGNDQLEFQRVDLYPQEEMQFPDSESRDEFIRATEQELNSQIEWTNTPNNGSLAFGIATLTDPELNDKPTYWGRYFKQKTADMMGKWSNGQVPLGWKLQTAGAMKLDIGIDPQHLIKTDDEFNGVINVIQAVKKNSAGNDLSETLVNALETIHTQEHPVFPGQIKNLPALRDYFGEIMGPVALMSEMVGGQADDAKNDLLKGQPWASCSIFWPMAMNAPLVDSYFTAPDGTRVGISSKGGYGAKASVKNIQDAILKASEELKAQYPTTVNIINIVQSNSAKNGPFRLAELYKALPQGLEEEINGYIQQGKTDYAGLSPACTELFNYGTPKQDIPGFNTGYAMLALLAKKVAKTVNELSPDFGLGCIAFLNQSSIVQLYCKMGKQGDDARVTGWNALYPPNFQGTIKLDGSKSYYSSRIGGKFAFGFK